MASIPKEARRCMYCGKKQRGFIATVFWLILFIYIIYCLYNIIKKMVEEREKKKHPIRWWLKQKCNLNRWKNHTKESISKNDG